MFVNTRFSTTIYHDYQPAPSGYGVPIFGGCSAHQRDRISGIHWYGYDHTAYSAAQGMGSLTDFHYGEDFSKYPDYTWEWNLVGGSIENRNYSGVFFHNQQRDPNPYTGSLHGHHLQFGSSGSYQVTVCYDYTGQGLSGMFCDFDGGNRTGSCDGSPAVI